jgi:hypothetical protein
MGDVGVRDGTGALHMNRTRLHRWRNCFALSALLVTGMTVALASGQASGVMLTHPPGVLPVIHHESTHLNKKTLSERVEAAQAAAALSALKALFALPPPAAPPELALTPSVPSASGSNVPKSTALAPAATPAPAVPATNQVPPRGQASAYGCTAAMAYLEAYAAPDFIIACAIDPSEHQATTTCISGRTLCGLGRFILIADPCAAAYMNEASNSWVLMGLSDAPIDPYGSCH